MPPVRSAGSFLRAACFTYPSIWARDAGSSWNDSSMPQYFFRDPVRRPTQVWHCAAAASLAHPKNRRATVRAAGFDPPCTEGSLQDFQSDAVLRVRIAGPSAFIGHDQPRPMLKRHHPCGRRPTNALGRPKLTELSGGLVPVEQLIVVLAFGAEQRALFHGNAFLARLRFIRADRSTSTVS